MSAASGAPDPTEPKRDPPRDLAPERRFRWIGALGAAFIRAWGATLRIDWIGREAIEEVARRGGRVVFAFWHGHLLTLTFSHRRRGIVVLVSRNKDGEIISQIICRLGFGVVRGSTSRGAVRALLEMARAGRDGRPLGVTPDGPRGPRHELQPGVLQIAQRSGLPIVPLAVAAVRRTELRSWDRFLVPHPFSRVAIVTGRPISLPGDLAPEALAEQWGPRIAAAIDDACARADAWRAERTGER
ncbi:MAG: lysophospholipid acyltransferase family protein [Candidatus Eisenbacteria bacterium]